MPAGFTEEEIKRRAREARSGETGTPAPEEKKRGRHTYEADDPVYSRRQTFVKTYSGEVKKMEDVRPGERVRPSHPAPIPRSSSAPSRPSMDDSLRSFDRAQTAINYDRPPSIDSDVIRGIREAYGPQWQDMTDASRIKTLGEVYDNKYFGQDQDPRNRLRRTSWIYKHLKEINPGWDTETALTNRALKSYESYAKEIGIDPSKHQGFADLSANPEWSSLKPAQMRAVLGDYYDKLTGGRKGQVDYQGRENFVQAGVVASYGENPWTGAEEELNQFKPDPNDRLFNKFGEVNQLNRYKNLTNESLWWADLDDSKKRFILQQDFNKTFAADLAKQGYTGSDIDAAREKFIAKQLEIKPEYAFLEGTKQYGKSLGKGILGIGGTLAGKGTRSWESYSIVDPTYSQQLADYNDQMFGAGEEEQARLQREYGARKWLPGMPVAEAPGFGESMKQSMAISLPSQVAGYGAGLGAAALASETGPGAAVAFKGAQMATAGIVSYALAQRLTAYDMIRDLMTFEKEQFDAANPGKEWTKEEEQRVRDKYRNVINEYAKAEALPEAGAEAVTSVLVPGAGGVAEKGLAKAGVTGGIKGLSKSLGEKLLSTMGKEGAESFAKFMEKKAVKTTGKVIGKAILPEVGGALAEIPSEVITQGWQERVGLAPELKGTQYEARGSGEITLENVKRWTKEVGPQAAFQGLFMGGAGHITSKAHQVYTGRKFTFNGEKGAKKADATIKTFNDLVNTGEVSPAAVTDGALMAQRYRGEHGKRVAAEVTDKALTHLQTRIAAGEKVLATDGGDVAPANIRALAEKLTLDTRENDSPKARELAHKAQDLYVSALEGQARNLRPFIEKGTASKKQVRIYNEAIADIAAIKQARETVSDTQGEGRLESALGVGQEPGGTVPELGSSREAVETGGDVQAYEGQAQEVAAPIEQPIESTTPALVDQGAVTPQVAGEAAQLGVTPATISAAQPTTGLGAVEPGLTAVQREGATQAQAAQAPVSRPPQSPAEQRLAALPKNASFDQYVAAKLPGVEITDRGELADLRDEFDAWQNEPAPGTREEYARAAGEQIAPYSGMESGLSYEQFAQRAGLDPAVGETEAAYEDYQQATEGTKYSKRTRMTGMRIGEALKDLVGGGDNIDPIDFDDERYWYNWIKANKALVMSEFRSKVGTNGQPMNEAVANWIKGGYQLMRDMTVHVTMDRNLIESGKVDVSIGSGNMGDGFYNYTAHGEQEIFLLQPGDDSTLHGGYALPSIIRYKNIYYYGQRASAQEVGRLVNDFVDFCKSKNIAVNEAGLRKMEAAANDGAPIKRGLVHEALSRAVQSPDLKFTNDFGATHEGQYRSEEFTNYFLRERYGVDTLVRQSTVEENGETPIYEVVVMDPTNIKSVWANIFDDSDNYKYSMKPSRTEEHLKGREEKNGQAARSDQEAAQRGGAGPRGERGADQGVGETRGPIPAGPPPVRGVGERATEPIRGAGRTGEKSKNLPENARKSRGGEVGTGGRSLGTVSRVAEQFKTMSSQWANGPKGGLLALASDDISIPAKGRDAIKSAQKEGSVIEGYFDPRSDTVYVFPDLVQPRQNESIEQASTRVALEEVMRHKGIREAFGGKFEPMNAFLRDLYMTKRKQIEGVGIFDTYGWDKNNKVHQQYAAEEWFAHHYDEVKDGKGWLKRFADLVKRFARDTFGMKLGLTNTEIRDMARKSREAITKGKTGGALQKTGGVQVMKGVNQFAQDVKMSLAEATKKITDNPNFRKWFGESKVVDEKGEPLVVVHGTDADFNAFDPEKRGSNTFSSASLEAFFFAGKDRADVAATYAQGRGSNIMPVYLSMQNPLIIDQAESKEELIRGDILRDAKDRGHDGAIIKNTRDSLERTENQETFTVYAVFEPTQIKSIFNQGTFDPTNPDIRKSQREGQLPFEREYIITKEVPIYHNDEYPDIKDFDTIPSGPFALPVKPIAKGLPLYRQTDTNGASDILRDDISRHVGGMATANWFVSDSPELALGQKGNRGVFIEFRPNTLSGEINHKPGTDFVEGKEYIVNAFANHPVLSVTFDNPSDIKKLSAIARRDLRGWKRETLPGGEVKFTRPIPKGANVSYTQSGGSGRALFSKRPISESLPEDVAKAVLSPEAAKAFKDAQGMERESWWNKKKKDLVEAWRTTRQKWVTLNYKKHSDVADLFRVLVEQPQISRSLAARDLDDITKNLAVNEYDAFSMKILYEDMYYDLDKGYLDPDTMSRLPLGIKDKAELRSSIDKLDKLIEKNENVQKALKDHRALFMGGEGRVGIAPEMVSLGLLPKIALERKNYWHHQVLMYRQVENAAQAGGSAQSVSPGAQSYQKRREWSGKDYNTDYLQSYYEVLAGARTQIETQKTINKIKEKYDVKEKAQAAADKYNNSVGGLMTATLKGPGRIDVGSLVRPTDLDNIGTVTSIDPKTQMAEVHFYNKKEKTRADKSFHLSELRVPDQGKFLGWMDVIGNAKFPEFKDHMLWYDRGGIRFNTYSVADKMAVKMMEGVAAGSKKELKDAAQTIAGEVMALPKDIAVTMNNLKTGTDSPDNIFLRAGARLQSDWKIYILLNPVRAIKYNVNNMSGDMDIVFAHSPRIFRHMPRAMIDLYNYMLNTKSLSKEVRDELKMWEGRAVLNSGWAAQEVGDITKTKLFRKFAKRDSATLGQKAGAALLWPVTMWFDIAKGVSTYRENILRLAAARHFRDELEKGKTVYAASWKNEIDAISDNDQKAAKLARELLGDYGNLTHFGEMMRRQVMPFYSWMEINAPRYVRLMANSPFEGGSGKRIAAVAAADGALRFAWTIGKMGGFFALVNAFNHTFFPDEEEELGIEGLRQMHIILGRNDEGHIRTLRLQGAFSDALGWFGGENVYYDYKNWKAGDMSWNEWAEEAWHSPINKLVSGIRPDIKTIAEVGFGQTVYPDAFNPRPIRDSYEHVARVLSAEVAYRHIAGLPVMRPWYEDMLAQATIYATDPDLAAYYDARNLVRKFYKAKGKNIGRAPAPDSKSNHLYQFKVAMKYGDKDAAVKYWNLLYKDYDGNEEKMAQGIANSIERGDPLEGLADEDRKAFFESLSERQAQRLVRGINWFNRVYRSETDEQYRALNADVTRKEEYGGKDKESIAYKELKEADSKIQALNKDLEAVVVYQDEYYAPSTDLAWSSKKDAENRQAELKELGIETEVVGSKARGFHLVRKTPDFPQEYKDAATDLVRGKQREIKEDYMKRYERGFEGEMLVRGRGGSTMIPFKNNSRGKNSAERYKNKLEDRHKGKQFKVVKVYAKDGYESDGYMVQEITK